MRFTRKAVATLAMLLGSDGVVLACTTQLPVPPPQIWVIDHGDTDFDGRNELWIGIEVDLFAPTGTTNCSCGIGLGTLANPLPPGVDINGAMVAITDTVTHDIGLPLPEFSFSPSGPGTAGWQGSPGASVGSLWAGFSASVDPFVPPPLGPNEVFKLWFEIELPVGVGESLVTGLPVQFGAGTGNPDGSPNFSDPEHPAVNFDLTYTVPEPSTFSLTSFGLLGLLAYGWRRRRRA